MKHQTYREGWLPGYVYSMVHSRPGQDLYEPPITIDHYLPPSPSPTSEDGASTATATLPQAEEPSHVR
jgi:hypothetical protein